MVVSSYISPKAVKGRPSEVAGRGLTAVAPIAKDEIVAIKGGHLVEAATLDALPERLQNSEVQVAEPTWAGERLRRAAGAAVPQRRCLSGACDGGCASAAPATAASLPRPGCTACRRVGGPGLLRVGRIALLRQCLVLGARP